MRIVMTTKAGRGSFENVELAILEPKDIVIWTKDKVGKSHQFRMHEEISMDCELMVEIKPDGQ